MDKTCFVIIGYGEKYDPYTKLTFNLDSTYLNLIKPVFEDLGIECFRAIDKNESGVIDKLMFEWIYKADLVVADISTLNPNVMYELGVRHVLKPHTTIILAESNMMKKLPFDISHLVVHSYEHLGKDIGVSESRRVYKLLKDLVEKALAKPRQDSPVYDYLPNFRFQEIQVAKEGKERTPQESFAGLLKKAEAAKEARRYEEAMQLYQQLRERDPYDDFLVQRLALVTYKSKEPDELAALQNAEKILLELHPEKTLDTETLGLMGAIHKKQYGLTKDPGQLDKAIQYVRRGFEMQEDYYNGINLAYLYDQKANLSDNAFDAMIDYRNAGNVREKVLGICKGLLGKYERKDREDYNWIVLTQAEAAFGLGKEEMAESLLADPAGFQLTDFELDSFRTQLENLKALYTTLKPKMAELEKSMKK